MTVILDGIVTNLGVSKTDQSEDLVKVRTRIDHIRIYGIGLELAWNRG